MGNEKSNRYWEAELPSNFDKNDTGKFIRAKYEEKRWVSRGAKRSAQVVSEMNSRNENFVGVAKRDIPHHTRRHSLDVGSFAKHMAQDATPTTRSRRVSFDMKNGVIGFVPPKGHLETSMKSAKEATDLFGLLYIHEAKQEAPNVVPAHWATFDCI
ncbi:hypothetical protein GH714_013798 [Hevea brasiliensis]|uniref:Uncharacterized protein n=1 Tax=Hevea brasiliensis TaxID=3981 RepID=A0A6A6KQY2_HEVBR|nr:hypothetical protein GH714_013798 [Hevea brasiliensis]